jgi:hypothetical protein
MKHGVVSPFLYPPPPTPIDSSTYHKHVFHSLLQTYYINEQHCGGQPGFGRYYPNSVRSLAQTTTSQTILKHIGGKCRFCPSDVRKAVLELQRQQAHKENLTTGRPRYGSRKIFFQRMWARLHGQSEDGVTPIVVDADGDDDDGGENSSSTSLTAKEIVSTATSSETTKKAAVAATGDIKAKETTGVIVSTTNVYNNPLTATTSLNKKDEEKSSSLSSSSSVPLFPCEVSNNNTDDEDAVITSLKTPAANATVTVNTKKEVAEDDASSLSLKSNTNKRMRDDDNVVDGGGATATATATATDISDVIKKARTVSVPV